MSESPAPIGVLVVDDHPLLRDGLAALLGAQPDLRLLGEAADGEEAIACYQQLRPDVVLMDLQMPRLDGVEAIVRIRAMDPRARIIVLTTYRGDVRAVRALQAGASAYLLKDMLRHELVDTIRMVAGGRRAPIPCGGGGQHCRARGGRPVVAARDRGAAACGRWPVEQAHRRAHADFRADGEGTHEEPDGQARCG